MKLNLNDEEIKKGITIRVDYEEATIDKEKTFTIKKTKKLIRKISLIDAPGHETLMATMLSGSAIVDGAILVIAANEPCPQPQTKEHLMALEIMGIKDIIIVQNKIDLVSEKESIENYEQIKKFIKIIYPILMQVKLSMANLYLTQISRHTAR